MDDVCFTPQQIAILTPIGGVIGVLFWGWINSLRDSVREARAERDRMADGWEQTIGLGEQVVKQRTQRTRRDPG